MRPELLRDHAEKVRASEERLFWFRSRRALISAMLLRHFPSAQRGCEFGCGTGYVLAGLRRAAPHVRWVGGDMFIEGLRAARTRVPDVPLVQMNVTQPPFPPIFDVVCLFDVLEHVEDDRTALDAARRLLRPGGGLLLTVPQHAWLWSAVDEFSLHFRRDSRRGLRALASETGFRPIRLTSFTSFLLPAMLMARLRARRLDDSFDPFAEHRIGDGTNAALFRIMEQERALIERGVNFPAGGSLLLVATRA